MDLFESMRIFKQVVESNGFAAAARTMSLTRSTVNKHVVNLESKLGTQLFVRSTRSVRTTETGKAFYDRAIVILSDLDEAISAVSQLHESPMGRLRVNGPMSFGTMFLSKAIAQFMQQHNQVQVELTLSDRFVDPIEEGFDVTIRITEPKEITSLISKEIAQSRRVICASPAYLESFGEPEHPRELYNHRCLHYGYHTSGSNWQMTGPDGEFSVPINCAMWSNNGEALRDAASHDQGIALLPEFIAIEALRSGRLVEVLIPYSAHDAMIYAIYPRHRHLSVKVRIFVQFMIDHFSDDLMLKGNSDSSEN